MPLQSGLCWHCRSIKLQLQSSRLLQSLSLQSLFIAILAVLQWGLLQLTCIAMMCLAKSVLWKGVDVLCSCNLACHFSCYDVNTRVTMSILVLRCQCSCYDVNARWDFGVSTRVLGSIQLNCSSIFFVFPPKPKTFQASQDRLHPMHGSAKCTWLPKKPQPPKTPLVCSVVSVMNVGLK